MGSPSPKRKEREKTRKGHLYQGMVCKCYSLRRTWLLTLGKFCCMASKVITALQQFCLSSCPSSLFTVFYAEAYKWGQCLYTAFFKKTSTYITTFKIYLVELSSHSSFQLLSYSLDRPPKKRKKKQISKLDLCKVSKYFGRMLVRTNKCTKGRNSLMK